MKIDNEIYSTNKNGARKSHFFTWLQACGNLLFPTRCQCCGILIVSMEKGMLCDSCHEKITFLAEPSCPVCGLMFLKYGGESHPCVGCSTHLPFFSKAQSLIRYSKDVRVLVYKLKFSGDLSVLQLFGMWAEKVFSKSEYRPDYIVPVPLHPERIKVRGFNQAALLAKVFFPTEKHKIKHLLKRIENTIPQTQLDGECRRKNLKNCFSLPNKKMVQNKIIYLVDDVYTTGTTVNECARIFMGAGASRVEVFTLAMVVKENEN